MLVRIQKYMFEMRQTGQGGHVWLRIALCSIVVVLAWLLNYIHYFCFCISSDKTMKFRVLSLSWYELMYLKFISVNFIAFAMTLQTLNFHKTLKGLPRSRGKDSLRRGWQVVKLGTESLSGSGGSKVSRKRAESPKCRGPNPRNQQGTGQIENAFIPKRWEAFNS